MSDPQPAAPVPSPAHALDAEASAAPPGFFARAEHAIERIAGHGDSAPIDITGEPQQVVKTADLHSHAAQVLDLVKTILELEADHHGQAGLDGLAIKALRVAGSVAGIAGLAA